MTARDYQASARRQGSQFEKAAETLLLCHGWMVVRRHWVQPDVLVEIDIVAIDPHGIEWWIECKGSWESESGRNGLRRTDTTKKLIGTAAILRLLPPEDRRPYMVITSHLPRDGAAARWLQMAEGVFLDRLWVGAFAPECCSEDNPTPPKAARKRRSAGPPALF